MEPQLHDPSVTLPMVILRKLGRTYCSTVSLPATRPAQSDDSLKVLGMGRLFHEGCSSRCDRLLARRNVLMGLSFLTNTF